jgi:hypothetical protein
VATHLIIQINVLVKFLLNGKQQNTIKAE